MQLERSTGGAWSPDGSILIQLSQFYRVGNNLSLSVNIGPPVIHSSKKVGITLVAAREFKSVGIVNIISKLVIQKNAEVKVFVTEILLQSTKNFWLGNTNDTFIFFIDQAITVYITEFQAARCRCERGITYIISNASF